MRCMGKCTISARVARILFSVAEKTVGPVGRVACEPGQSLIAAAISGVVRASVSLAVFTATALFYAQVTA